MFNHWKFHFWIYWSPHEVIDTTTARSLIFTAMVTRQEEVSQGKWQMFMLSLTLTQTPGTRSEYRMSLEWELQLVWPKQTQRRHAHQTASPGLVAGRHKGLLMGSTAETMEQVLFKLMSLYLFANAFHLASFICEYLCTVEKWKSLFSQWLCSEICSFSNKNTVVWCFEANSKCTEMTM